ncbi:MAG: hypothetical protein EOO22_04920 [Comamonadaceae bacterium]|nr:MAG: hypothetical protein EOO22_04920 [Comamonadaceae bacterium]
MRVNFEGLIDQLCLQCGIDDAEALLKGLPILVDGRNVWLEYLDLSDLCRIVVDLGALSEHNESLAQAAMLLANFDSDDDALPVMGLHPETGHAMLAFHVPLRLLEDAADLYELLTDRIAPVAEFWIDTLDRLESGVDDHDHRPSVAFLIPPMA